MTVQSRKASIIESLLNVAVGVGVAFISQVIIFNWLFGMPVSLCQNVVMTLIFTVISIVRSYALRRIFNGFTERDFTSNL